MLAPSPPSPAGVLTLFLLSFSEQPGAAADAGRVGRAGHVCAAAGRIPRQTLRVGVSHRQVCVRKKTIEIWPQRPRYFAAANTMQSGRW